MRKVSLTITMPAALRDRAQAVAAAEDRSVSWWISRLVEGALAEMDARAVLSASGEGKDFPPSSAGGRLPPTPWASPAPGRAFSRRPDLVEK